MPPQRRAGSTGQKNKSSGGAKKQKPNAKSALASLERKRNADVVEDERREPLRKEPKRRKGKGSRSPLRPGLADIGALAV